MFISKHFLPILLPVALICVQQKAWAALDYQFFEDCPLGGAYYYSNTESSGSSWIYNLQSRIPVISTPSYTPGSSLQLKYFSAPGGNWKATLLHRPIRGQDEWDNGVYIQAKESPFISPAYLRLQIKAGKDKSLPKVALEGEKKQVSSFLNLDKYLSAENAEGWSNVQVPLKDFAGLEIKTAEQVKAVVFAQGEADGNEHSIYIDHIELRPDSEQALKSGLKPQLTAAKPFERHIDLSWRDLNDDSIAGTIIERSADGVHFVPVGYRAKYLSRYADFLPELSPEESLRANHYRICYLGYDGSRSAYSNTLGASTKAASDDELLNMVQEACFRYYFDGAESESGMALESIPGDPHMVATGASGFGIMSLVVGAQRGFAPREQIAARLLKILSFLNRADRFHGVFSHYYDGRTGHPFLFFGPDDNGGDLVETSFLMQGLLTARSFFDGKEPREAEIRAKITKLWEEVEWDWYKQKADSNYLYWHWSPDKGWKINHRLIGWNESLITYCLAIASPKHAVSPKMYYSGFASQERLAQEYRGDSDGKMYSNGKYYYGKKLDVGGFSGGPIFFTHYNFLGLDPHGLRDRYTEYFENSKAIAEINLRYCQANPAHHQGYGDTGWGLTASDAPWAYNPDEPRAEGDKGKLTPTGSIASMPYLPDEAMAALKKYYRAYGSFLWGEYGFRDAFSFDDHWVNNLYMGLNQGPMAVMIENYRSGLLWKLFGANPEIQRMRARVFETK